MVLRYRRLSQEARAEERYKKAEEALESARQKALDSGTIRRTFRRTGGPLQCGSIVFPGTSA